MQQEKHTNSKQKKQLKSNEKFQQQQTENITKILHKKVKNRAWSKKIAGTLVDAKYKYQPGKSRRSSKLNDLFCITRFYGLSLKSQINEQQLLYSVL